MLFWYHQKCKQCVFVTHTKQLHRISFSITLEETSLIPQAQFTKVSFILPYQHDQGKRKYWPLFSKFTFSHKYRPTLYSNIYLVNNHNIHKTHQNVEKFKRINLLPFDSMLKSAQSDCLGVCFCDFGTKMLFIFFLITHVTFYASFTMKNCQTYLSTIFTGRCTLGSSNFDHVYFDFRMWCAGEGNWIPQTSL